MATIKTYEEYWSITNAFTNYNGGKFLTALEICVVFIDEFKNEEYSEEKYNRLQERIRIKAGINLISIRKAINQLVKLGFINSFLVSYNPDSIEYLKARTNRKRQSLLSKIVYSNSSFNRAVNIDSNLHQLNFLIKTLIDVGCLTKEEIKALMLVDIANIEKGYLNKTELLEYVAKANAIGFTERKYNQVGYLNNLLNKLDDLIFVKDTLYFEDDAQQIFGDELRDDRRLRDPYLHRLYKNQLREESISILGSSSCMVEKLDFPVLIASHIKPFARSTEQEAYDANNGILLSRNMDSLFDLGYISFNDDGEMLLSKRLSDGMAQYLPNYGLDRDFLNENRVKYLQYHRKEILR